MQIDTAASIIRNIKMGNNLLYLFVCNSCLPLSGALIRMSYELLQLFFLSFESLPFRECLMASYQQDLKHDRVSLCAFSSLARHQICGDSSRKVWWIFWKAKQNLAFKVAWWEGIQDCTVVKMREGKDWVPVPSFTATLRPEIWWRWPGICWANSRLAEHGWKQRSLSLVQPNLFREFPVMEEIWNWHDATPLSSCQCRTLL